MKILKSLFYSVVLGYAPFTFAFLLALTGWGTDDMTFFPIVVLIVYLVTFPFYVGFVELGCEIFRLVEHKKRGKAELSFDMIRVVMALISMIFICFSGVDGADFYIPIGLSAAVIVLWIFSAVAFKKKFELLSFMKTGRFWLCFLAAAVAISVVPTVWHALSNSKNKPEPQAERTAEVTEIQV